MRRARANRKTQGPRGEADRSVALPLELSDTHRMLLEIRDTLYEGCWDDFAHDLEARRRAEPHVFETVPESPDMLATIGNHLALIAQMQEWERKQGTPITNYE